METIEKIEYWTGKLLWFLAIGAGVLSYVGMRSVAMDAGFGYFSYLWPLVTESAVAIFSLVLLNAKLKGYEKTRWITLIILVCAGLSSLFNMYHAPKGDAFTRFVWGLPPIFLLAAFETWIWKIEQDVKRIKALTTNSDLENELSRRKNELKRLEAKMNQVQVVLEAQPELTDKEARKMKLVEYLKENPYATQDEMAQVLNVTRPTVGNYLSELAYHKNGNGWEYAKI